VVAGFYLFVFAVNFDEHGVVDVVLKVTPAMALGVTNRLWEIGDIVALIDERRSARHAEVLDRSHNPFGSVLGHQ
jgi:hypothetical protein